MSADNKARYGVQHASGKTVVGMLSRGLRRRCPSCGGRNVFANFFRLRERCPRCGIKFERLEGFSLGVMSVNLVVTLGLIGVVLIGGIIATVPDIPTVPLTIACSAIAIVVPLVFYPAATMIWLAAELAMSPLSAKDLADADDAVASTDAVATKSDNPPIT